MAASKVARVYIRVSTDEQDVRRQESIIESAKAAGYYVAAVYREKASGARADRPELLRMIADLQAGEVVIAEKMDRISRLPLPEAEQLVQAIRAIGEVGPEGRVEGQSDRERQRDESDRQRIAPRAAPRHVDLPFSSASLLLRW